MRIEMLYPPPNSHNWESDGYHNIKCKKCGQSMAFYSRLDPRETFDSTSNFDDNDIILPLYNSWVMQGWAAYKMHPTKPVNCNEAKMIKALT